MPAKTIVITGATDGLGREVALALAADGHRLILHGRRPEALAADHACQLLYRSGQMVVGALSTFDDVLVVAGEELHRRRRRSARP